jgi:hypothetical protein
VRDTFTSKTLPYLDVFTAVMATECYSSAIILSYFIYNNDDTLPTDEI